MERTIGLARRFRVPTAVCLTKANLSAARRWEVERSCAREEILLAGSIPFGRQAVEAMLQGGPVTADGDSPAAQAICQLWEALRSTLEG